MPALVTPFRRNGDLDLDAHRHNLGVLTEAGVKGFLLGGSTGEGPLLEPGEREALVSSTRAALGPRPFLLVGIAAESVRQAMAQVSETAGADAVTVLTPTTLARDSVPAQVRFFTAVADASPLPVFLYSVPRYTGYPLAEPAVVELSGHPVIVGMKDSGGDPVRIHRMVIRCEPGFRIFNGSSASAVLAIAGGAHGVITASTNYLPSLVTDLVAAARRSPARAMPLQDRLARISAQVEAAGVPGVKAAALGAGLRPGYPRAPLAALSRREAARLADLARI